MIHGYKFSDFVIALSDNSSPRSWAVTFRDGNEIIRNEQIQFIINTIIISIYFLVDLILFQVSWNEL